MKRYVRYSWIALCVIAQVKASAPGGSKWPIYKIAEKQAVETQQTQPKASSASNPPKSSAAEAIAAGTVAGMAEVGVAGHALSYVVNRMVQGDKVTLNTKKWGTGKYMSLHPRDVYRGVEASAAGMAGITAIQVAGTDQCKEAMENALNRELTGAERLAPPFVAGVAAGVTVAPVQEGVPNYQQNVAQQEKRNLTSWQATQELRAKYGNTGPFRGATATGVRDGKFTLGYKVLPSIVEEQASPYFGNNEYTHWASKIGAGVLTAVATQPWHVAARHMQNNRNLKHTAHAMSDIYTNQGIRALWKSGLPRGIRVTIAIPVLSWTEAKVMAFIKSLKAKK